MTPADLAVARSRQSRALRVRSRRGFSILELVVVLVLVGIVGAISTGRISNMRAQQQVNRASTVVQTHLEKAFAIAGRNRAPVRITWTAATLKLNVTNRAGTISYGETRLGSDFGLKAGEVTATSTMIEVYPNGFASGTFSMTITTVRGQTTFSKTVSMTRAGLVKVT